jgi:hypothetical protein
MVFGTIFMLCIIYPILAQQDNKITVVNRGYRITGQIKASTEKHFNNLLESTLSKDEFSSFMALATNNVDDLNRIEREIGRTTTLQFEQRFDYTVYGDITVSSGENSITTVLIHNKTTRQKKLYDINVSNIESVIKDHALIIINLIKDIQLDVTIDSIKKAAQDGNIDTALMRLEIYRYKYGDSTELQDIELSLRKQPPDTFSILNAGTKETLRKAGALIDAALAANSIKDGDKNYQLSVDLLNILSEDEREEFQSTINNIQNKIEKYTDRVREFNTGGIGLAYFGPLLLNDLFSSNILDYYPDIFGLSLTWFIPRSDLDILFDQFYIRFTYLGFNNHAIQKAAYLEDAAIYGLSLSAGFQFCWMLEKNILPYIYFGGGYTHFIEYASDITSEAFLNFGQINYQAGLGLKLHIPTMNLMLSADMGTDFGTGNPMTISLNYSFGLTYLFYGKKRTF